MAGARVFDCMAYGNKARGMSMLMSNGATCLLEPVYLVRSFSLTLTSLDLRRLRLLM